MRWLANKKTQKRWSFFFSGIRKVRIQSKESFFQWFFLSYSHIGYGEGSYAGPHSTVLWNVMVTDHILLASRLHNTLPKKRWSYVKQEGIKNKMMIESYEAKDGRDLILFSCGSSWSWSWSSASRLLAIFAGKQGFFQGFWQLNLEFGCKIIKLN